ncbi:MAG: creatininase family protein [Spirochaetales bacterium]|nr:creatininase family protein [Spirochaetales bacterium]
MADTNTSPTGKDERPAQPSAGSGRAPRSVRLEELNQNIIEQAGIDKAILAIGACESHGGHLPFGTDTFVSHGLAVAAAERLGRTVVVPPLWYGVSVHYRHKPMCITLNNDTMVQVLRDVFASLDWWGIRKVFVVCGHDGNIPCIEIAARDAQQAHPELRIAVLEAWWTTAGALLPPDTFEVWNGLGHGGEGETSIGLAMFPHLVDMSQAKGMIPELPTHIRMIWNFQELTDYGASGAPEKGTVEKGEKMKKVLVDHIVEFIEKMDSQDWKIRKA